jgi:hypothetical protein
MVLIEHGVGAWVTKYMHLSHIAVQEGSFVSAGQQIGLSGTTNGNKRHQTTVNPHLHFAYQPALLGVDIDPMLCLPYTETVRVTPEEVEMEVGQVFLGLSAHVADALGQSIAGRTILYRSLTDILGVDRHGVIEALSIGTGEIEVSASLNTRTRLTVTVCETLPCLDESDPFTGTWVGTYSFGPMTAVLQQTDASVQGQITDAASCVWGVSGSVSGSSISLPSWTLLVPAAGVCIGATVTLQGTLDASGMSITGQGSTTLSGGGPIGWSFSWTRQ